MFSSHRVSPPTSRHDCTQVSQCERAQRVRVGGLWFWWINLQPTNRTAAGVVSIIDHLHLVTHLRGLLLLAPPPCGALRRLIRCLAAVATPALRKVHSVPLLGSQSSAGQSGFRQLPPFTKNLQKKKRDKRLFIF